MENTKFYNYQFEKQLLSNLLHSSDYLEYITSEISPRIFHNPAHKKLYNLILRYYKKYFKPLPQNALDIQLRKEPGKEQEKAEISLLFTDLQNHPVDEHTRFYVEELRNLTTNRDLFSIFENLRTGLQDEKISSQDLLKATSERVSKTILDNIQDEITRTSITGDVDERWREYEDKELHPEKYLGIPFGFPSIDNATGGIFSSHVGMIFGRTGSGKTRMLFSIACNAAQRGKTVMFFTIEMAARMVQHMWESRVLGTNPELIRQGINITYNKIARAQLRGQEKEEYKRFLEHSKNNPIPFYIYDYPRGCTPSAIEAELLTFIRIHGKKPDLILADYANIMKPDGVYEKTYEKFDILFNELKQIARVHNLPIVTAMQQNRESLKSKHTGTEHIGLSDRAADHCDFILNLRQDEEDPLQDSSIKRIIVQFVKARFNALTSCQLLADFSINYFKEEASVVQVNTSTGEIEEDSQEEIQETLKENKDF